MEAIELLGAVVGLAFVSGINLYATVLTVGLGVQTNLLRLHPDMASLSVLSHPAVLLIAAAGFMLEFFADKIPWVDSLWDGVHTIVRPLGAAILASAAFTRTDPALEVIFVLLSGGLALTTHSGKAGTRLMVNHSPEPFSNTALSLGEDALAVSGSVLAVTHPFLMMGIAAGFVTVFLYFIPRLFRLLRLELLAVGSALFRGDPAEAPLPKWLTGAHSIDSAKQHRGFPIRCVSGNGVSTGKNRIGYLVAKNGILSFITRRRLSLRTADFDPKQIQHVTFEKKRLLDRLSFRHQMRPVSFYLFKGKAGSGERIAAAVDDYVNRHGPGG